ncbi:MAG: YfhO family protein [Chloroflexi bacterium]|nr:YfhO family protein [Chloroflexota bacterium]
MGAVRGVVRRFGNYGWLRDLSVVLLLLLVSVFLFSTDLTEGRIYYESDTATYYYPVMSAVDRAIDRSTLPLWTPHIFGGYPLFADGEGGALYPPNLLLLWLFPIQNVFLLFSVVRFFLASVFQYAFCRTLGIGRSGSLLGGLIFAYSSFMIGQLQHTNLGNSAIWLPLVLLFAERAMRYSGRKRYLYLLLGGGSVGMQSVAVHVQPVILTLFALALYVVFRTMLCRSLDVWQARGDSSRVGTILTATRKMCVQAPFAGAVIGSITVLGIGLAAVQLLPLYELAQFAERGTRPTYLFGASYALPVTSLATLVFPYFFIGPNDYYWSLWNRWETTVYAAIAPSILASLAIIFVRRRTVLFFGFLAALSLYLALGDYPPLKLYWLLWQLPGFHSLRDPGRFSFLFVFSVAVLAPMGLDWLTRTLGRRASGPEKYATRVTLFGVAMVVLSVTLLAGVLAFREIVLSNKDAALDVIRGQYLKTNYGGFGLDPERVYQSLLYSLDVWNPKTMRPFIFLIGVAALLLLWVRFRRLTSVLVIAVLMVSLVDLMTFAVDFHPRMPFRSLSIPSGVAKFLVDNNGLQRVYNRGFVNLTDANKLMTWRISKVGGYSSLSPSRNSDFNRAIESGSFRLLDLWNVRYIVTRGGQAMPPEYTTVYQEDDVAVYENPHPLPRAFLVSAATFTQGERAVLSVINEGAFDPSRVVVLEESFDQSLLASNREVAGADPAAVTRRSGEARIVEYDNELVGIDTTSSDNAFLLLSDSYYPGWKAYVDGQETKIYRANYLFRGVFLPAGSHQVIFRYEPTSFYVGRIVSLATLFFVVVAAGILALAPRRLR